MPHANWSRSETLMALAFYLCPPPSRKNWDDTDSEIRKLAQAIGRSESAICFKIGNLKSCDPNRSGKGFKNAARLDLQIMGEYLSSPSSTIGEALADLADVGIAIEYDSSEERRPTLTISPGHSSHKDNPLSSDHPERIGRERTSAVRTRINQDYFRTVLMTNYNGACCLTGIRIPELLIASHIKPWAVSTERERLLSSNGILLNALHDRAFDRGLITLDDNYRIVVSTHMRHSRENDRWLFSVAGNKIHLPRTGDDSTWPSRDFIHYHNDCVFMG